MSSSIPCGGQTGSLGPRVNVPWISFPSRRTHQHSRGPVPVLLWHCIGSNSPSSVQRGRYSPRRIQSASRICWQTVRPRCGGGSTTHTHTHTQRYEYDHFGHPWSALGHFYLSLTYYRTRISAFK